MSPDEVEHFDQFLRLYDAIIELHVNIRYGNICVSSISRDL